MDHHTILLYGADEFLGMLFVAEAVAAWAAPESDMEVTMILGGRDPVRLHELGKELAVEVRVFACDTVLDVAKQLSGVDILVLAASIDKDDMGVVAGAVMQTGCDVVDLNLDVDAYRSLDALKRVSPNLGLAWVRGAGPGAGPSSLLLDAALRSLQAANWFDSGCIGAIRIGHDCVAGFSRASAESGWRALARDVTIVRAFAMRDSNHPGHTVFKMRCDHVPIGRLERQFDYGVDAGNGPRPKDVRIASAANLIDSLCAADAMERIDQLARRIETYVAVTSASRLAYQAGAHVLPLFNPVAGSDKVRALCRSWFHCLPDGPDRLERSMEPHTIVIEIEDEERTRVIDWRLRSPNFYEVGARLALATTEALASRTYSRLVSPAEVLEDCDLAAEPPRYGAALRGCVLDRRLTSQAIA